MKQSNTTRARGALGAGVLLCLAPLAHGAEGGDAERGIAWSGTLEVEAVMTEDFAGTDTSDLSVATLELGVDAAISDGVSIQATLLHEEGTDLEVDQAILTLGDPEAGLSTQLGQLYVPFGTFETNLVSDPLTLDLGETRESAVLIQHHAGGFSAVAYLFNGDSQDSGGDTIEGYGVRFAYAGGGDEGGFTVALDYISSLADSDTLQDGVTGVGSLADYVGGLGLFAQYRRGGLTVNAEYVTATDAFAAGELAFQGAGAEPSAFNLEVGLDLTLAGRPATVAAGYQGTDEALALGLPKRRTLVALATEIYQETTLAFEWARDEDYDGAAGGTGNSANTYTVQVAVAF